MARCGQITKPRSRRRRRPGDLVGVGESLRLCPASTHWRHSRAEGLQSHRGGWAGVGQAELTKGVHEVPDGSNRGPEVDIYTGMEGVPNDILGPAWCAYFASWNFAKAPGGSPFGRIGGAQSIVHYCLKNISGSVIDMSAQAAAVIAMRLPPSSLYVPRCGDLGVIANGQIHGHAIQVAASQDGTIWSIEGNSGNAVRMRKRLAEACRWYINFDAYARSKGIS